MEGVPALEGILESEFEVVAVITLEEKALSGRSGAVDYGKLVDRRSVPLHRLRSINEPASVELLRSLQPDVLFVIGWSQILSREVLSIPRIGTIGAHASWLPHNRGSAPVNWGIIKGEAVAGNTLIWLSDKVDEGRIIDQVEFPITVYDTCHTIYEKVAESNEGMIMRALEKLASGEPLGRIQEHTDEPLLPHRRPADGLVDWAERSKKVYDFVRALTRPYPGAISYLEGQRYLIWEAALLPTPACGDGPVGEVAGPCYSPLAEACGQVVHCGCGAILLLEVENEDGRVIKGIELSDQSWTKLIWTNGKT